MTGRIFGCPKRAYRRHHPESRSQNELQRGNATESRDLVPKSFVQLLHQSGYPHTCNILILPVTSHLATRAKLALSEQLMHAPTRLSQKCSIKPLCSGHSHFNGDNGPLRAFLWPAINVWPNRNATIQVLLIGLRRCLLPLVCNPRRSQSLLKR